MNFGFLVFSLCLALKILIMISDERLLEYDIDSVLFDEISPFQRVQIVHSKILGNMLVLDDLQSETFNINIYLF